MSFSAQSVGSLAFCTSTATSSAACASRREEQRDSSAASAVTPRAHTHPRNWHPSAAPSSQRAIVLSGLPVSMRQASGSRPARHCSARSRARRSASRQACATSRWIVVNSNESAARGLVKPGERLGLEALDVDLHEGRRAVLARSARRASSPAQLDARVPASGLPSRPRPRPRARNRSRRSRPSDCRC